MYLGIGLSGKASARVVGPPGGIEGAIRELTVTNERTLLIGLVLLTVGTLFGAVWANESWGRYWGWDPKETWTLVTIMIYVAILHLRLMPNLHSIFTFNIVALLGFGSVLGGMLAGQISRP